MKIIINSKLGKVKKVILISLAVFGVLSLIFFCAIFMDMYDDTSVPKVEVTYQREKLDNDNKFDRDCYVNEEYYSKYVAEAFVPAARTLFEKTGVQLYYFYLDITLIDELETDKDVMNYIDDYIDENVENKKYAFVIVQTNSKVIGYDKYGEQRIGYISDRYIGSKADEVFDSEGEKLFNYYWEKYDCEWDDKGFQKAVDNICNELMNYEQLKIQKTISSIVIGVVIIALIVGFAVYKLYRKHVEDTVRILNTPVEKISEDYLKERYDEDSV